MFYVYKYLNDKNEVLYVGQTIDLDRRFNEHKGHQWDIEKSKILFAKCNTLSDMNIYEMYYINKLKAKYNTALVFNDVPSFELPELTWEEYDKNHYETKTKEVEERLKNKLNKFAPDVFWKNRLDKLMVEFDNETDFVAKKEILLKIRECEIKIEEKKNI